MEAIRFKLALYGLLLWAGCYAAQNESVSGDGKAPHTLYFLSMLPYEEPGLVAEPAFTDGPYLFPFVQQAVEQVNSRPDILEGYQIELIEGNGGCDITTIAYVSFVSEVFHSGKQVVGVVGPGCSDSAVTVSTLCSRSEISFVTVHIGNSPLLADRERFPYAFTNSDTTLVSVDATLALMEYNDWHTVAFLYEVDTLVFAGLVEPFLERAGDKIVYSSPIFFPDVPLNELEDSFARIIVVMMDFDNLCRLLCMARSKGLLFPAYQYVSVGNSPYCYSNINFTLQGTKYSCSGEEQIDAMEGILTILTEIPSYNDLFFLEDSVIDSVWSLALALNNSLDDLEYKNLSLSDYQYGHDAITRVVQEEFHRLNFDGETGRVQYSRASGSRSYTAFLEQHFGSVSNNSRVGTMETGEWNVSSDAIVLSDSFPSEYIHVSEVAAAFALISAVVIAILVILSHILTIVYQNYKSVKASSPRLNHFVYVGCYLILVTMVMYTIMETFEIGYGVHTAFCNLTIWFVVLGFTLILGTVLVKTWRLYHIFIVASSRATKAGKLVSDWFLAVVIVLLLSVDSVICLLWSAIDPLVQDTSKEITGGSGDIMIEVRDKCRSESDLENVMIPIIAIYKVLLMACSVCLAFLTRRIELEDFKTHNITLLIYMLTITCGLGFPIFLITQNSDEVNLNIPFVVLCAILSAILVLCFLFLFLPPLYPLLLKKYYVLTGHPLSKSTTGYESGHGKSMRAQSFKPTSGVCKSSLP